MSFRERLDTLSRGEIAGLIVVLVAALGGAGPGMPAHCPSRSRSPRWHPASRRRIGVAESSRTIIVDVAGEVEQPGVYEFAEGDRVIDAIERRWPAAEGRPQPAQPRGTADGRNPILVPKLARRAPSCRAPERRARRAARSTSTRHRRRNWRRCPASARCSRPRSWSTASRTAHSHRSTT